ncbi:MAG: hypothetical protein PHR28_05205 [candidate division Zixibacteria bacterium]|nr:hypothetical protein [candidate division Zixibacteria bacterium]
MSAEAKAIHANRGPLTITGWVLFVLSLILCVTALLISNNPLYFVFGVTAVSFLGIVVAVLQNNASV